jgi:pyruvate kinase
MNLRKSKIVAKIADNKSEISFLTDLLSAGADVFWLNTAHQDEPETLEVVKKIRQVSTTIPILLDTKGPEVRTKNVETPITVKPGDHITFTGDLSVTGENVVHVTYPNFQNEVPVGEEVLYDDASIDLTVVEKTAQGIKCVVKNNGVIKNKKSLNIPNVHIELPALTEKDTRFIHFCAKENIDYIIHSFVRNKKDIFEIKDILKAYPDYAGKIIAKIENREGFENLEEILDNCEGLMVARGDLGAEVPLEEMTYMQKKMVEASLRKGKYCIVATQVLDSMIKNPRPTRAEVTDASNAILDGSGAISMSGETAYGDYPLEATTMMSKIMMYTELKRDELVHFTTVPTVKTAAYELAEKVCADATKHKAKAIVVLTGGVEMSQAISAYRPGALVVAGCMTDEQARDLMLAYAVRPVVVSELSVASIKPFLGDVCGADDMVVVVTGDSHTVASFGTL